MKSEVRRPLPVLLLVAVIAIVAAAPLVSSIAHAREAGAHAVTDARSVVGRDPPAEGAAAPKRDFGTRWVFLAAIAGLGFGAGLAYYRKRRERPSPPEE